jgi:hypothetical protein
LTGDRFLIFTVLYFDASQKTFILVNGSENMYKAVRIKIRNKEALFRDTTFILRGGVSGLF